jgi:hypothetical protein
MDMTRHFLCLDKQLTRNKSAEIQLSYFGIDNARALFNFVCRWTVRRHHAGPQMVVGLLGLYFEVNIHDHRHWSDEARAYEEPGV